MLTDAELQSLFRDTETDRVERKASLSDTSKVMAMAQESRKPIFRLKPADGAIGGHQQAVLAAYKDYAALARVVAERSGVSIPPL